VLREELKPIPKGPGPILEALFSGSVDLDPAADRPATASPPAPNQLVIQASPAHRNASPPALQGPSPASSVNTSNHSGPIDDDFDNPFAAFMEARHRRLRGIQHGLNFPDSPIGSLPLRRRLVIHSSSTDGSSPSRNSTTSGTAADESSVIDLTELPDTASPRRQRSVLVEFYTCEGHRCHLVFGIFRSITRPFLTTSMCYFVASGPRFGCGHIEPERLEWRTRSCMNARCIWSDYHPVDHSGCYQCCFSHYKVVDHVATGEAEGFCPTCRYALSVFTRRAP
jgi:hypothetical protein